LTTDRNVSECILLPDTSVFSHTHHEWQIEAILFNCIFQGRKGELQEGEKRGTLTMNVKLSGGSIGTGFAQPILADD
jgi:hypothetical protein